jgi:hypothetical protein
MWAADKQVRLFEKLKLSLRIGLPRLAGTPIPGWDKRLRLQQNQHIARFHIRKLPDFGNDHHAILMYHVNSLVQHGSNLFIAGDHQCLPNMFICSPVEQPTATVK